MGNPNYGYIRKTDNLGIGVEDMALALPYPTPVINTYGPRYNVRGSFMPFTGGGQFPLAPFGPFVGLRANGVYLSGDYALGALTGETKK